MKLCITLDDVLRAKTQQFGKMYQKYIDPSIDLEQIEITTNDYSQLFNFESTKEYNKFLYDDCGFPIWGEANMMSKMLDKNLNLWHIKLNNNEDLGEKVDVMLANPREFNQSIGFTYFFLSKAATRIREVFLPADSSEIWTRCDVLVTADPKLLNEKPEGKISIKIEAPYNKECKADYTYDSLATFIADDEIMVKLTNKDND